MIPLEETLDDPEIILVSLHLESALDEFTLQLVLRLLNRFLIQESNIIFVTKVIKFFSEIEHIPARLVCLPDLLLDLVDLTGLRVALRDVTSKALGLAESSTAHFADEWQRSAFQHQIS